MSTWWTRIWAHGGPRLFIFPRVLPCASTCLYNLKYINQSEVVEIGCTLLLTRTTKLDSTPLRQSDANAGSNIFKNLIYISKYLQNFPNKNKTSWKETGFCSMFRRNFFGTYSLLRITNSFWVQTQGCAKGTGRDGKRVILIKYVNVFQKTE